MSNDESNKNWHFISKIYFSSINPCWAEKYLNERDFRLTSILGDHLKNEFWMNYAKQLTQSINCDDLLLRAKYIESSKVILLQAWKSERLFADYKKIALQNYNLKQLLYECGINTIEIEYNTCEKLENIISNIKNHQHIFQHISDTINPTHIKTGDPLKSGYGFLPFPEEIHNKK